MKELDVMKAAEEAAKTLGIDTAMGREALQVALLNLVTFNRKQHDYGSGNIAAFGEFGVLVRANDKMERLKNLLKMPDAVLNEAITDSWLDLANYAIIGYLCHEGRWV